MTQRKANKIREQKRRLDRYFYRLEIVVTFKANIKLTEMIFTTHGVVDPAVESLEKAMIASLCQYIYAFVSAEEDWWEIGGNIRSTGPSVSIGGRLLVVFPPSRSAGLRG